MRKIPILIFFLIFTNVACAATKSSVSISVADQQDLIAASEADSKNTSGLLNQNKYEEWRDEMDSFRNNFYDKTLQNVNLALQGANRATTLVSVFAVTFTLITLILGVLGFREVSHIRKVRVDAEKNLRLTKHLSLAFSYSHANLFSQALSEFLQVLRVDDNNEVAHTQLGFLYMSLLKPDLTNSITHSKKAIKINPNNFTAQLNLGVVVNRAGAPQEEVVSIFLKGEEVAIANGADDITVGKFKLFAGHAYKKMGQKDKAKIKYDEARPYFETQATNSIAQIAELAKSWLEDLKREYDGVAAGPRSPEAR